MPQFQTYLQEKFNQDVTDLLQSIKENSKDGVKQEKIITNTSGNGNGNGNGNFLSQAQKLFSHLQKKFKRKCSMEGQKLINGNGNGNVPLRRRTPLGDYININCKTSETKGQVPLPHPQKKKDRIGLGKTAISIKNSIRSIYKNKQQSILKLRSAFSRFFANMKYETGNSADGSNVKESFLKFIKEKTKISDGMKWGESDSFSGSSNLKECSTSRDSRSNSIERDKEAEERLRRKNLMIDQQRMKHAARRTFVSMKKSIKISRIRAKMMNWKCGKEIYGQTTESIRFGGHERNDINENELCKKRILMGGRCRLPNFTGALQYDEDGNVAIVPANEGRQVMGREG